MADFRGVLQRVAQQDSDRSALPPKSLPAGRTGTNPAGKSSAKRKPGADALARRARAVKSAVQAPNQIAEKGQAGQPQTKGRVGKFGFVGPKTGSTQPPVR